MIDAVGAFVGIAKLVDNVIDIFNSRDKVAESK